MPQQELLNVLSLFEGLVASRDFLQLVHIAVVEVAEVESFLTKDLLRDIRVVEFFEDVLERVSVVTTAKIWASFIYSGKDIVAKILYGKVLSFIWILVENISARGKLVLG